MFDFSTHFVIFNFVIIFLLNYVKMISLSELLRKTVADNNNGEICRKFNRTKILGIKFALLSMSP